MAADETHVCFRIEDQGDGWHDRASSLIACGSERAREVAGYPGDYYLTHPDQGVVSVAQTLLVFETSRLRRTGGGTSSGTPVYLFTERFESVDDLVGQRPVAGIKASVSRLAVP